MATDVEESDTDDRERPAPPKRQCTRLITVNETLWDTEKSSSEKEEVAQDTRNIEYDDAERQANEKLKRWQACQVAKGFADNTFNEVLDSYIQLLGGSDEEDTDMEDTDMEDTAVMMAIRNHGLVQSNELVSQSSAFYSDKAFNQIKGVGNFGNSLATASTNSLRLNDSANLGGHNASDRDLDKIDESDQQENFLERAVAEAIKKKGLSALSVDYG